MATITSDALPLRPLFMQATGTDPVINYTAADFARLTTANWLSPGIITPTSFRIEQAATPGWTINIRSGIALVGTYLVQMSATYVLSVATFNTAPAATRTHYVYLVVYDKNTSGTEYAARIVAVEDTGAGVAPPTAAATLLIGSFVISPGQSSILDANISPKPVNASDATDFVLLNPTYLYSYITNAGGAFAPARVRYGSGKVYLSGAVKRVDGQSFISAFNHNIGFLPEWLAPRYDTYVTGACSTNTDGTGGTGPLSYRLQIDSTGQLVAQVETGFTPDYLFLDGIQFEVD